jgi:hypothetical protein
VEEEDEDDDDEPAGTKEDEALGEVSDAAQADAEGDGEEKAEALGEESAFSKWFWEKRGDNNRAWKKRRREALRDVRKRENKRLSNKVL